MRAILLAKPIIRKSLPNLYKSDVMKFLYAHGDVKEPVFKRKTTGSHDNIKFTPYGGTERPITVPGHNNKPIPMGTLKGIIKRSGIPEEKWRNFRY